MDNTEEVIQVFSDVSTGCPRCEEGPAWSDVDWFADQVNHLLGHGYRLLHVGQESTAGAEGQPWQRTTAVLAVPTP